MKDVIASDFYCMDHLEDYIDTLKRQPPGKKLSVETIIEDLKEILEKVGYYN